MVLLLFGWGSLIWLVCYFGCWCRFESQPEVQRYVAGTNNRNDDGSR